MTTIRIERLRHPAKQTTLDALARLHRDEIHEGFLASLGMQLLRSLYDTLHRAPESILFAAWKEDQLVGFICGSTNTGRIYRQFLWRHGARASMTVLPRLLSWDRMRRAIETLLYPARSPTSTTPSAEVLNFCVDKQCQGLGMGQQLFGALCDALRQERIDSLRIVTGAKQISAQRFYESAGATRTGTTEVHQGDASILYLYALETDAHASQVA